jgi:uncharacterized protein (TIGR00369 family)
MSEVPAESVPEGFEQLPEGLGYTDSIQPSYRRIADEVVSFGLVVQQQHGNSMGICHGGVLMTLADMAGASGVNMARGELAGSPTISLSLDFVSAANIGEWIQADVEQVDIKRRFGFCRGSIYSSRGVVARFGGNFYFPDHDGMWKAGRTKERVLQKIES